MACLGLVLAQEEAGNADDASGEAAEGKSAEGEECEESWEYIEFLRSITDNLEKTFQDIRDVQNKVGSNALVDSVSQTLTQVLKIRESVLDRIFKLRKKEIPTCPNQDIRQEDSLANLSLEIMDMLVKLTKKDASANDKLKQIRDDLFKFKDSVTSESLRIMMLPQVGGPQTPQPTGDCSECDVLELVDMKIMGLINCAEGKDTQDDADDEAGEGGEETPAAGGDGGCMPPAMYIMEVMAANRRIDEETESLLPSLVSTVDEAERAAIEKKFNDLKQVREKLENSVKRFSNTKPDNEDKLKKIAKNMKPIAKDINKLLKDCQSNCDVPPSDDCDSCGANELTNMLSKMDDYKRIYNNSEEDPADLNSEVRKDLMKFISANTATTNELLQKKIEAADGVLEKCDQERLDVFNKTKGPMWMLVNTTIFTEGVEEPTIMLGAMEEMMKALKEEYCKPGATPRPPTNPGESCEWAEYEQTGEYLKRIDKLIQEHLFKPKSEDSKVDAQLDFLELRKEFDSRVQQLFENGMVCPDEVVKIKKEWMTGATKCMSLFMNSRLKFKDMSRLQRIQCTKNLKIQMEDRRSELLSKELENSINQFEGNEAEFGYGPPVEQEAPITDYDLPEQPNIIQPPQ